MKISSFQGYVSNAKKTNKKLIELTHGVILNLSDKIEFKISYNVPFYKFYKSLCYINQAKKGIYVGFMKGKELSNEKGYLSMGKRKSIAIYQIFEVEDVLKPEFTEILMEAMILNEYLYKK